ncbi:MAG TPA: malectin domain-containing carbohydrate-binding protein, partial [Phycisphaerae bacterium]|nr:malectin domain-containing carbohydrate-binding protein [Phycisphaerae bacterium]
FCEETMEPIHRTVLGCAVLVAAMVAGGCDMGKSDAPTLDSRPTIRVKAGATEPFKDSLGVMWYPDDQYVEGGTVVDRSGQITITGTKTPEMYTVERYSMDYYTFKVPNGKYELKLHFSEDYDGISDPAGRLFTYVIKDGDNKTGLVKKEQKDFGPWKMSGAAFKACVVTEPLTVARGAITIEFKPQVENPQINATEIIPQ